MIRSIQNGETGGTKSMTSIGRRRQRLWLEKSMVLFLTIVTLFPLSMTLVLGEKDYNDAIANDFDQEDGFVLNEKRTSVERELEEDFKTSKRMSTMINTFDPTNNLPELLTSMRSKERRDRIWIVLAYHESCEECMELFRRCHHAVSRIKFDYDRETLIGNYDGLEINFVPMTTGDNGIGVGLKEKFLHQLGVARLPSLFFLWDEEKEEESILNLNDVFRSSEIYRGRSDSVSDLVNGLYHYLARLRFLSASPLTPKHHEESVDWDVPLTAVRVQSLRDLQDIIRNNNQNKIFQHPRLPLDPDLSQEEDGWIRYLMDDDFGAINVSPQNNYLHDDMNDRNDHDGGTGNEKESRSGHRSQSGESYHVIVQCRNMMGMQITNEKQEDIESTNSPEQQSSLQHSILELYQGYNQAAKVLGARRDVLFLVLKPHTTVPDFSQPYSFCNVPSDDGLVKVWDFYLNEPPVEGGIDEEILEGFSEGYINISSSLLDNLRSHLLPPVLWFDRRMTAPIAFHPQYRRHAILIVDFYDQKSGQVSRDIIRLFRDECRRLRKKMYWKVKNLNSTLSQSAVDMIDVEDVETSMVCLIVPVSYWYLFMLSACNLFRLTLSLPCSRILRFVF